MSICLGMILKNEEKTIKKLLNTVFPLIDCYCFCDIGSTDKTISLVKDFFKKNRLEGKLFLQKFNHYGYHKNFLLKSCQGMSDFILFLDGDFILETISIEKKKLEKNSYYQIFQGTKECFHPVTRIIPNNVSSIHFIGYTFEYLNIPSSFEKKIIPKNDMFFYHSNFLENKKDRYPFDIKFLKLSIQEKKNIARNTFYLANCYFRQKEYKDALEYYIKRTKYFFSNHELWFCYYQMGKIYNFFKKKEKAIDAFLQAITYHPNRIENIYEIIKIYRLLDYPIIGMSFYKMAQGMMVDEKSYIDCLFFQSDIYRYRLDYEYCILGFYNNIKNIDEKMISIMNQTKKYHKSLLKNLKYYIHFLPVKKKKNFTETIQKEINGQSFPFFSSSSCFIPLENKYFISIRYVNYSISYSGNYKFKKSISIYKIIELNKNLDILSIDWIVPKEYQSLYNGIDDVRLFPYQKKIFLIGNSNKNEVHYGYFEKKNFTHEKIISEFPLLPSERNWVYTIFQGKLCIIYQWSPFILCSFEDFKLRKIMERTLPGYLFDIQGSSCGFSYHNEIWFIVHQIDKSENLPYYYHSILVFNENYDLLRYTPYFKISKEPIEFSLSISIEKDIIFIPMSTMDKTTELLILDKNEVELSFFQHKN